MPTVHQDLLAAAVIVGLSACAEAPAPDRTDTVVAPPATKRATPAPKPAVKPPPPPVTAPAPAEAAPELPPPDLEYATHGNARQPPPAIEKVLAILVARLKQDDALSMRITTVAPPIAGREYAIGLASRVADALRSHVRRQGVAQQKIIRSVIDPRRATVTTDDRVRVEIRLMKE